MPGACALDEEPHLGVAEAVDRLHRIADREQRAAVAGLPAGGQPAQELELRERRVLELVDQQVIDACVEREQQVGRRARSPSASSAASVACVKSSAPASRKATVSRADERGSSSSSADDDGPRLVAEARRRQPPHGVQCLGEAGDFREAVDQFDHALLPVGPHRVSAPDPIAGKPCLRFI